MEAKKELSFDDLDMSKFTDEEKSVIETIKNIIENPNDFIDDIFVNVRQLLNNIYSDKEKVIDSFKKIINAYKKHSVIVARKKRIIEIEKIIDSLNKIIKIISETSRDYIKISDITGYIQDIESYYLEPAKELLNEDDYNDTTIDDDIDEKMVFYKNVVDKWQPEIIAYHNANKKENNDIRENTNNLVFCLNDDIDLSIEGFKTGFATTVADLETKSSRELKALSQGQGLERIKKSTETGHKVDFVEYFKSRYHIQCRFVPYRYRSGYDNRVGLIKFEPSQVVKEHLEERYGLSKQSAYYGIFMMILVGATHREYADFESYILKNRGELISMANLFASDNPDFKKLDSIIDEMLNYKKERMNLINKNTKTM